jgi:hypothetical protein
MFKKLSFSSNHLEGMHKIICVENYVLFDEILGSYCGFRKNLSIDKALFSVTEEIFHPSNGATAQIEP